MIYLNTNCLDLLKDERDLKSKDLASIIGVCASTYSEWEHSKIPIPTRRLIELANYYEINIDYLSRLTDNRCSIKSNIGLDLKKIGIRIKEIRNDLGLSLRELGSVLNCSFSSIASYERGEKLINSEILISLAKFSKCSIDYILLRSNDKCCG